MSIEANMVGRLHVSISNIGVIRYVRSRFTKKARRDPKQREARKRVYRKALECHRQNQSLFHLFRF